MEKFILINFLFASVFGCNSENKVRNQVNGYNEYTQSAEIVLRVETDEMISNPLRIATFDDGFILYDNAKNQIKIFTDNGGSINIIGREGRGSGEFESV